MKTLSSTVERLVGEGFTGNFGVVGGRLRAYDSGKGGARSIVKTDAALGIRKRLMAPTE